MEVSVSDSEALVIFQKSMGCPPQGASESLPQVKEFKYLRLLFMCEGNCCCLGNNVTIVVKNCLKAKL